MMILQGSSLYLGSELDMRKNVHACSCSHDYETAIGSLCRCVMTEREKTSDWIAGFGMFVCAKTAIGSLFSCVYIRPHSYRHVVSAH